MQQFEQLGETVILQELGEFIGRHVLVVRVTQTTRIATYCCIGNAICTTRPT